MNTKKFSMKFYPRIDKTNKQGQVRIYAADPGFFRKHFAAGRKKFFLYNCDASLTKQLDTEDKSRRSILRICKARPDVKFNHFVNWHSWQHFFLEKPAALLLGFAHIKKLVYSII